MAQTPEVIAPPQILAQPQPQVVSPGALASFFVVAANTRGLAYQWRFNGTNISGSGNDALLLQNVGVTNEGFYSVVLTNSSGSITSAPAALMLDGDGDGLPDSWELTYFGNLTNTTTGDFDGDGVSNLTEFLDGSNPTNSASVNFRLTVLNDAGSVNVVPNKPSYTNGEVVTLTATAVAPNIFHAWTGDVNLTNNPLTLVMNTNKTVIANLAAYDISWGNQSGSWHVYTNWIPNFVPGPNDNVFINGQSYTVIVNGPAECRSLTLGGGTGSPTLTGSGELILHGDSTWSEGPMSGTGRTVVSAGVKLTMGSASQINLTTRTLENAGTVVWTGAGSFNFNGAVITNRPGALFEVQNAAAFVLGSPSRVDNAGTFRKASNTGTTTMGSSISFNNYGAVEIQAGTLVLSGGGTHTGTFDVSAGTTLNLRFGTHTASVGSSITGAGQFIVGGGTANLAGLVNVSGTNQFDGGTANLTGNYICTNNSLVVSGGTANFSGTGMVTPAVVNQSSGTLSGNQNVTVGSVMNWTGGTMTGGGQTIIPTTATLNIASVSATVSLTGGRVLENGGTIFWTAGNFGMNGAVITNRAGALFEARNAVGLNYASSPGSRFDNAGTFRKSVVVGTTTLFGGLAFNNYGTVEILDGTLALSGGGGNSGNYDVAAGTTLSLSGGAHTASAGSSITGAGNFTVTGGATPTLAGLVNVTGTNTFTSSSAANLTGNYICTNNTLTIANATVNFNGTGIVTPAVISFSGGTLSGNQTVTVLNQMNWTGGTMTGGGRTIIPPGVTLTIPSIVTLNSRTLDNGGTVLWTGGNIVMSSAVITNRTGALFDVRTATGLNYASSPGSRFDNAGTFRKSVNTGTATIFAGMAFKNYNTVDIQTGILVANGGYTSTANSLLNCALGGTNVGTGYGRLQVAGTVTLNGSLGVSFANGFLPTTNDTFTVVTAGTRSGTFASFHYPSNEVTMQLNNTANSVVVQVTAVADPKPVLLQPELIGPDVKLTWTAISNRSYLLEFNPDLNPSNWIVLPGDIISLSNTASKLDALTSSNRFYRVRVLP